MNEYKFSMEAISPYQSLIGFRYHRGVEVMEDDSRVPILEFQLGIGIAHITFTKYYHDQE